MTENNPNILLLILDSVRAKNTSLHNNNLKTTPYINKLTKDFDFYTNARAPSSWSLPSHASIFTGEHPHSHGITHTGKTLPEGNTIFESLQNKGYKTSVFTQNPFLVTQKNGLCVFEHVADIDRMKFPEALDAEKFVFSEGEGQYISYLKASLQHQKPLKSLLNGIELKLRHSNQEIPFTADSVLSPGKKIAEEFNTWICENDTSPWATCINLMDAHTPYEPTKNYESTPQSRKLENQIDNYIWDFYSGEKPWWLLKSMEPLYNDSIRDADYAVKSIIENLKTQGLFENTLIVVTSDHGEAFGEFSETNQQQKIAGHGRWLTEELIHVPLLVKKPQQKQTKTITKPSSLTEFPAVVKSVLENSNSTFVPQNEPVISSVHWEDTHLIRDFYHEKMPIQVLNKQAKAVYEEKPNSVKKTLKRGDNTTVWDVHSATSKQMINDESAEIEKIFNSLKTQKINTKTEKNEGYSSETIENLKDLGYA